MEILVGRVTQKVRYKSSDDLMKQKIKTMSHQKLEVGKTYPSNVHIREGGNLSIIVLL